MFKKVEVFDAEKVIRINMFISNSHDLARVFIGDVLSKRLIFLQAASLCEQLTVKHSRYSQPGAVRGP
jgi:hypothetical protein